jgi:glycosyltransferase involved in cell wall biosynthesis
MFAVGLDLTRLALAPVRRAPRGIDRVELAYARYFLNHWPGDCLPVLPMPWGVRCYRREQGIELLDAIERLWRESSDVSNDVVYLNVLNFLSGNVGAGRGLFRAAKPSIVELSGGYLSLLRTTGISFGKAVERALPQSAVYLNVGQLEVYRPFLSWLSRRSDVSSFVMIHDLIPLELPEHHLEIGIKLHERIVRNTVEFADGIIVPSEVVRSSVIREFARYGGRQHSIHVEALAIGPEFLSSVERDPRLDGRNYFVVCGAIDSYKNHLLVLKLWRHLVQKFGPGMPRLIIAGSPGVTSDQVMRFIQRHEDLQSHVMLAAGLCTAALRRLMASAKALLMPSLAEGFGLPIIEALSQGTPVIASNIPAHREAGRAGDVFFCDPTDEAEWRSVLETFSSSPRSGQKDGTYRPKTWDDYFSGVVAYLTATRAD